MEGVSLKEYLEEKIDRVDEKVDMLSESRDEALKLKTEADQKHFEALNGEAGRLAKILEQSIPREVHDRDMKEIAGKIGVLDLAMKDVVTKEYLETTLKSPNSEIRDLTSLSDIQAGKSIQKTVTIALLFSLAGLAIGIIGVILNILR